MNIQPLFPGFVHYPTAAELEHLAGIGVDMRHPDDRTPDLSKPVAGPGFKKKVLELARIIYGAGKHDE